MRLQWRFLIYTFPLQQNPHSKTLLKIQSVRYCTAHKAHPNRPNPSSVLGWYFAYTDAQRSASREQLGCKVSMLTSKLVEVKGDAVGVSEVLDEMGLPLFCCYFDGSAFVELLNQLRGFPHFALQVFNWRRNHARLRYPMSPEEYAKGISVAGRVKNVDLAVALFTEAINNGAKTPSVYNSLMGVYMMSGMPNKCQSLFYEFKKDECCCPTVVTYNILISVFARLMLVDHMEATLQEMYDAGLSPTCSTFNNLIAGYITAWMWDRMESTFMMMNAVKIKPDKYIYMLMLRGYAHSGNLEKMEEIYERGKHYFGKDDVILIRHMICAYCKNSCANRLEKIDSLISLIPECEYRPWLNVLLIRVYAEEQELERMENFINIAFEQHTTVDTMHVMRSIITAYYRLNAVEKLTSFVKRAESAGWRICRSLYHCKMVMYATQNRLEEMENVLGEMDKINIFPTKKTWTIMYKAYSNWGTRCKLEQVKGLMCKMGYGVPLDDCPS